MERVLRDRQRASARRYFWSLTLCSVLFVGSAAFADDGVPGGSAAPPDTSHWVCSLCTFGYGWSGDGSLGIAGVTGGDYAFGEYSGDYHNGLYLDADGNVTFRDPQGYFFDGTAGNLGLDSRWIDLQGGRQGLFELHGLFNQIPQFLFDTGETPFLGAGGTNQTLPPYLVYGGSPAQMTALAAALHPVDISNQRRSFDLGMDFTPRASRWDFVLDFRHDLQTGTQISGANLLTTATQLAQPVDYSTDQIDASAGYSRERWQARIGYYGSFFSDGSASIIWSNPFAPISPGTGDGRMSLAPSSSFHQLSLTGGWQIIGSTRIMASLAYGRELQDSPFMSATINPLLTTTALPAGNLGGLVNTGNYVLRLTSAPVRRLSLSAEYLIDRRDNQTPEYAYQQVITDAFVGAYQTNLPYSFDRQDAKLNASYRVLTPFSVLPQLKLQAGAEEESFERTFEAVMRTHTGTVWSAMNTSFGSGLVDLNLKYSHARREFDNYQQVAEFSLVDNPLLRQFDLADRTREQWLVSAAYTPSSTFGLALSLQQNNDQYDQSPIGLTADRTHSGTLDANWKPTAKIIIDAYATRELIDSEQKGSQSFSVPDWSGRNDVVVDVFGIGLQWPNAFHGVDLGAGYNFTYSRESTVVTTGVPQVPFPDDTVNDAAAKLWGRYHLNARSTIRFEYAYERLSTEDWALDGVQTDTISNVLALGVLSPRYEVNVVDIRFQYAL